MIIEVGITDEKEPRRYRVRRQNGVICLQRLEAGSNGAGPAGDTIAIDWRNPEPGVYSLLIGGHSYDVHLDIDEHDEESLTVHLMSHAVRVHAADARRRRVAKLGDAPDGTVQILAPIPGRIARVLAPEGTSVSRGDGVIVVEAMKMENELKSPRDGTVTRVAVKEGQGVEGGALLATIE